MSLFPKRYEVGGNKSFVDHLERGVFPKKTIFGTVETEKPHLSMQQKFMRLLFPITTEYTMRKDNKGGDFSETRFGLPTLDMLGEKFKGALAYNLGQFADVVTLIPRMLPIAGKFVAKAEMALFKGFVGAVYGEK